MVQFVKSLVHKKPLQRLWGSALLHWSDKLNNKVQWNQKEIDKAVELLEISKEYIPIYFFSEKVQLPEQ